jgi:hypothetical protein
MFLSSFTNYNKKILFKRDKNERGPVQCLSGPLGMIFLLSIPNCVALCPKALATKYMMVVPRNNPSRMPALPALYANYDLSTAIAPPLAL